MAAMSTVMIRSIADSKSGSGAQSRGSGLVTGQHGSARASSKEFPPFRLDTVNQCLWRCEDSGEDEHVPLKPKPFAILRYLVYHAGRLVTQDELLDAVWPDTHV